MMISPLKECQICGIPYERGTRKPKQYANSRYCSYTCSGLAQRNTVEGVLSRLVLDAKTNCFLWTGHGIANGYGMVAIGRKQWLVHRLAWLHYKGPIPKHLQLDHLCGVKRCANVDHLRMCTAQENTLA